MTLTVVGVGSNINPQENIERVRKILSSENNIVKESKFIQTAPIGFKDQADFINGTFLVSVDTDFENFQKYLKDVEKRMGRIKTENKYAPRVIDLDVIVWDGKIVDYDFYSRDFLKKTTLEVLPGLNF